MTDKCPWTGNEVDCPHKAALASARALLSKIKDDLIDAPELNPRNFSQDDALKLDWAVCEAVTELENWLIANPE